MTTKNSVLQPITLTPGCQPSTDRTPFSTTLSTFSDKIRWFEGFPQKIGGWVSTMFNQGATIAGICRRMMSAYLGNETTLIMLLGTNENLYALSGSQLTNVTPLQWTNCSTASITNTSTSVTIVGGNLTGIANGQGVSGVGITTGSRVTDLSGATFTLSIAATATNTAAVLSFYDINAISGSLATDYRTLGSNPITAVNGSNTLTITDSDASQYAAGDIITISGLVAAVHGIPYADINGEQYIRSVGTGNYTIYVAAAATSSGTGGGSSVVIASGLVTVTATAHGQTNGQRTGISGAATFGGITAPQINAEFIVRGAATNSFQVMTAGTATSSVTAAGGSLVAYQAQIPAGAQDENASSGYGAGEYGVGLYGTALLSPNGRSSARIWAIDRFEAVFIMNPDNQQNIYQWAGSTNVAPQMLANAPQGVNYVFVSNNIIVTFGYQGVANQIFASDQANPTNWISSQTNQVFQDTIAGAGPLICHIPCSTTELIFTDSRVYTFTYVGLGTSGNGLIWDIQLLDSSIGIIGRNAGVVVNGVAFWMGLKNFFMWQGGNVTIIPSASQTISTINNYVFNNLTSAQRSKIFCWNNDQFNEIWWHYPSAGSLECDRVARLNCADLTWVPDTFDRTAVQFPDLLTPQPQLISFEGILYNHEQGTDADGVAMPWTLTGNLLGGATNWLTPGYRSGGKLTTFVESVIPDSVQVGDITLTVNAYQYPQSTIPTFSQSYTITSTTEIVPMQIEGRFRQYSLSGNVLGQSWVGGQFLEAVQSGSMQ